MRLLCGNSFPIRLQLRVNQETLIIQLLVEHIPIRRLEHLRISALRFSVLLIDTVIRHLVDEEERQNLNALLIKLKLLVEMCLNRLANLDSPKRVLGDIANDLSRHQGNPVFKAKHPVAVFRIQLNDAEAILIRLDI